MAMFFNWLISCSPGSLFQVYPKSASPVGQKYQFSMECMSRFLTFYHKKLEIKEKQNGNVVRTLI